MADFRNMGRGGPPPHMMRPVGPGAPHMMPPGPPPGPMQKPPGPGPAPFPTLCPDFLKGVCSVFQCPKNHPEASLLFCKAYQRDMCPHAQSCGYMHATVEEEQYYKDTGLIPLRFMNQPIRMERGKGPLSNGQPSLFPTDSGAGAAPPPASTPTPPVVTPVEPPFNQPPIPIVPEIINEKVHKMEVIEPPPPVKRQKLSYDELEIELNMMKEKVKVLEKKNEQLDSANDVLLEKNAKLRGSSGRSRERRSPDSKRDSDRSRHSRRDRRSRSKERGRSKEASDRGDSWKESNRGGSRWNNNNNEQPYNNNNNHANANSNYGRAM